jgi:murein DD-endopeptidase MepM/ murein hydrolase activator NlpD
LLILGLFLFTAAPGRLSAETVKCATNVTVQLSAETVSQGDLVLVELRSAGAISEVSGAWQERKVPFWQPPAGSLEESEKASTWQALLGIDLEKAAGEYDLLISGQGPDGAPISCKIPISIGKGTFATERLQVQKQFVEPSPEQLERSNRERLKLRAIFDATSPQKLWDGPFHLPLDGVTKGGNFGKRRILNGKAGSPHSGVDFPSPTGSLVHAAQRGKVVLAEELFFSGNTVVLDHGFGIYTFYGHLSEIDTKPGDLLEAGAILGKVGATGRVTGPHLHWGLTVERARVDPLKMAQLSAVR